MKSSQRDFHKHNLQKKADKIKSLDLNNYISEKSEENID